MSDKVAVVRIEVAKVGSDWHVLHAPSGGKLESVATASTLEWARRIALGLRNLPPSELTAPQPFIV